MASFVGPRQVWATEFKRTEVEAVDLLRRCLDAKVTGRIPAKRSTGDYQRPDEIIDSREWQVCSETVSV